MSSEALERAKQTVREALEQGELSHQFGVDSIAAFGALLAEVARLEQERDAWKREADGALGAMKGWRLLADDTQAALAAAREREQHLRAALNEAVFLLDHLTVEDIAARSRRSILVAIKFARAALVDEPAAATLAEPEEPTESVSEAAGSDASHSQARGDSGSASAAADEPGETPPKREGYSREEAWHDGY